MTILYLLLCLTCPIFIEASIENADISAGTGRRKVEDSIPVIEIRGEGKPMSSAQIRHLEEINNGGKPLDIKVDKTWIPPNCPNSAKRKDFVTFHYKVFTEDGKKVYQTYQEGPVTIQLGVGMIIPGLDKGLKSMCDEELRKIQVPFRLSRKSKSRVWKNIPNDEHWLTFNIEMVKVEPYSHERQFAFLDLNNDTRLDETEIINWLTKMRKDFGKSWKNEDIDDVLAAKYYIKYFDVSGDGIISKAEFIQIMERDEEFMKERSEQAKREKGRKRDPGVAWILDFNNDGIVSYQDDDDKSPEEQNNSQNNQNNAATQKTTPNTPRASDSPVAQNSSPDTDKTQEQKKSEDKTSEENKSDENKTDKKTDPQENNNNSQQSSTTTGPKPGEESKEDKSGESNEVIARAPSLGAGGFFIGFSIGILLIAALYAGYIIWQRKRGTGVTGYRPVAPNIEHAIAIESDSGTDH